MSHTQQASQNSDVDHYLMSQTAVQQKIEVDPKYLNVRMVTPIGRTSYMHLTEPKSVAPGQPAKFSGTLLLNPQATADIWRAIVAVANARWPSEEITNPENPSQLIRVNGEQLLAIGQRYPQLGNIALHSPLRDGNNTYMQAPQKHAMYRGTFTINASSNATQQPVCYDERRQLIPPDRIYSGCYARFFITVFAFPKPGEKGFGKRGISIALNGVQFAKNGERLGGFDAATAGQNAFAVGGPLPVETPATPGFGFNSGGFPGTAPASGVGGFAAPQASQYAPSGAVGGFAAPQAPQYSPQPQTSQQYTQQPTQQYAPPANGAPPGYAPGGAPTWAPPQQAGGFPPVG